MKTFYSLILTQIASLIGSRMSGIAVGIRVFQETGNASPILLAAFFAEVPGMVLGSLAGVLADRFDRRYVIILGDVGQAIGSIVLLVSFASGRFELWHLYAVMLNQGIFGILQGPASDAAITMLVPDDHRDRANGLRQVGFPLAGVIAPMVVGLLYPLLGVVGVIVVDLITFGIAVAVVSLLDIPKPAPSEEGQAANESFVKEILGGWKFLMERRLLLGMIVYMSFIYFLINGPLDLAIPYSGALTDNETLIGLVLGMMSLGALAGAMTITVVGRVRNRVRWIFIGFFWAGVMFLGYGVVRHPLLLGVALFAILYPLPLAGALFNSILQRKTPPDMQGRVFAVSQQLNVLATPFSFLLTAYLVDHVLEPAVGKSGWERVAPLVGEEAGAGMGLLMVVVGVLMMLVTVLVYAHPKIRHLESDLPDYL